MKNFLVPFLYSKKVSDSMRLKMRKCMDYLILIRIKCEKGINDTPYSLLGSCFCYIGGLMCAISFIDWAQMTMTCIAFSSLADDDGSLIINTEHLKGLNYIK